MARETLAVVVLLALAAGCGGHEPTGRGAATTQNTCTSWRCAATHWVQVGRFEARGEPVDGRPGVVIRAVRAVVRSARERVRLPSCGRLFSGPACAAAADGRGRP